MKQKSTISKNMVYRLPLYLSVTRQLVLDGHKFITAPQISSITNINVETVKKDLSIICKTPGNPRMGREANLLLDEISEFGVYSSITKAVIIGAGALGHALLHYDGFSEWGLEIVAAFDNNENVLDKNLSKPILDVNELNEFVEKNNIEIAVITVPAKAAQIAVNTAVASGIKAIWNFAPTHISVPRNIFFQTENMASSLSLLNYQLKIHNDSKKTKKKPTK